MKTVKLLAVVLTLMMLPVLASATSMIKMSEEHMIHKADRVAVGTIVESWVEWDPDMETLFTYSVLAIEQNLLGDDTGTESVILRAMGGQHEGLTVSIPSTPRIAKVGERKVVFMWDSLDLYPCNIIGWEQGCVAVDENDMVVGKNMSLTEYIDTLVPIIDRMKHEEAIHNFE